MAEVDAEGIAPVPDFELIDQVLQGNERSFGTLYERYFPRVFGFVHRRIRNRADTEEVVQEVFINVFSSLASFRREAPFGAWVLGVARRTVANRFKKKRHPTVPLEEGEGVHEHELTGHAIRREATPHEHFECGERIADMMHTALHHLTDEQRTLFEWHHLEDQSIREIANRLSKSEDAVKSHLYRARRLLLAR
jgi:RNA polymerase sigma-70 factor (ECF subfamily)